MVQVIPIDRVFPVRHIRNDKSGKVHVFWSDLLDNPTDGPRGRTRCGIDIYDEADWEITSKEDPVTCKNCLFPGHGNLDDPEDLWGYDH